MQSLTSLIDKISALNNVIFLGNNLKSWLIAIVVFVLAILVIKLLKHVIVNRLGKLAEKTTTEWDNNIVNAMNLTKFWFILLLAIFVASIPLSLPEKFHTIIKNAAIIALLIQAGIWLSDVIVNHLEQHRQKQLKINPAGVTTLNAIGFLSKISLWIVVLLLSLNNLGINITALVAGLGVGGIAVALAVQNILGDLLASLSILLDKPFAVGDFLIIDDHMGSVENVGLKTTRLRSLSGEQLVFSNSDLLKSRIRNYGRMYERRVVFNIGVTYQTPRDMLKRIPDIIRQAIEAQKQVRFDRSHFKEYGNFSLNFETVYYVLAADYNKYMDIQQAINLIIHEKFEDLNIEFAYPTQTVFVASAQGIVPTTEKNLSSA